MCIRNVKQNWNAIFFIRIYAEVGDWKIDVKTFEMYSSAKILNRNCYLILT